MGRKSTIKSLINYAVFAVVILLGYKYLTRGDQQDKANKATRREPEVEHPKNVRFRPDPTISDKLDDIENEAEADVNHKNIDAGEIPKELSEDDDHSIDLNDRKADVNHKNIDVGDIPKDLSADEAQSIDLNDRGQMLLQKQFSNTSQTGNQKPEDSKRNKPYVHDHEDPVLVAEEIQKRMPGFLHSLKEREEEVHPEDYKALVEDHEDLNFVTAGSHSTYYALIQLVYSIQYFYPNSPIVIYDIGLTSKEKNFIRTLCNTKIATLLLQLWPENLYKIRHRIWRPFLLQFAMVNFGHFVYVEPGRFINKQIISDYIEQSKVHGVVFVGKQLKYSTFYVTSPYMYSFLQTDQRRLQNTPHFEFSMVVLHHTRRVQQFFMRFLVACVLEEYCISPPGAKPECKPHNSGRKYGDCHRYDESAINVIMNNWHNFRAQEFLMRDRITMYHDGSDMTKKVRVCGAQGENNKREEVYHRS